MLQGTKYVLVEKTWFPLDISRCYFQLQSNQCNEIGQLQFLNTMNRYWNNRVVLSSKKDDKKKRILGYGDSIFLGIFHDQWLLVTVRTSNKQTWA